MNKILTIVTLFVLVVPVIWGQDTVTDIDGNVYQTVQIGYQLWMSENLKVTHYNDGSEIPTGYGDNEWGNLSIGAYAVYDDDSSNAEIYGYLYNWYAVDDDSGICPEGWHVPTDYEIKQLEVYLGMSQAEADLWRDYWRGTDEGSKLAGSADLWNDGNLENNPEFGTSGFDFLPGGYRDDYGGNYDYMGNDGYFWSSTWYINNLVCYRLLYSDYSEIYRSSNGKRYGFSVRCIRD